MARTLELYQQIERSILTKYRKTLWSPFTRAVKEYGLINAGGGSKRQEVKTLLRRLQRDNPNIEKSIFHSIHSVCLDTFPAYKTGGKLYSPCEAGPDGTEQA